ncbi:hypothetical protein [Catenulispora subtropica]|uniref:Adhesin domain-containing protein n=1 Tax=Catenulispora subtropica TaxID=450798 RepID=A0ABN2S7U5_9ACTN
MSDTLKSPSPARRPIAAVRISTVALIGIVAAVAVPAGAAALVMSGSIDGKHTTVQIAETRKVSKVVIEDADGSVHVSGDPTMSGVRGTADLTWHGSSQAPLRLDQNVSDGVLTLKKVCLRGGCGGADIDIRVPPEIAVQVTTSNAGIEVYDVDGGVDLRTANGGITAGRLGGDADMSLVTSNAGVEASFTGAPKVITVSTSNGGVDITTDGKTPYYDFVSTSNGTPNLKNKQDRFAPNEIHVATSNADVTIR